MTRMDRLSTYRTSVAVTADRLSVIYAGTMIVEKAGDTITLNSGGWETVTTKRKMNQAARQFALGYSVYQKDYRWFVMLPDGRTVPFRDGMTFPRYATQAAA
jgi:hypothetical protein